jgi:hypothetical protein
MCARARTCEHNTLTPRPAAVMTDLTVRWHKLASSVITRFVRACDHGSNARCLNRPMPDAASMKCHSSVSVYVMIVTVGYLFCATYVCSLLVLPFTDWLHLHNTATMCVPPLPSVFALIRCRCRSSLTHFRLCICLCHFVSVCLLSSQMLCTLLVMGATCKTPLQKSMNVLLSFLYRVIKTRIQRDAKYSEIQLNFYWLGYGCDEKITCGRKCECYGFVPFIKSIRDNGGGNNISTFQCNSKLVLRGNRRKRN